MIEINITKQTLELKNDSTKLIRFSISSAKNGVGQFKDSLCTPLGKHIIRTKIGSDVPCYGIFRQRRWSGEIWDMNEFSKDDLILSRILWLSGKEVGINRLGNVDTMQRYIYIHGTHDENSIGTPVSHGCIRMLNKDIIKLFNFVNLGESVLIHE